MTFALGLVVVLGASLLTALACTPLARMLAVRVGAVAKPTNDRWHKEPTALLGGVAMVVATAAGLAAATLLVGSRWADVPATAVSRPALAVGLSAALMFVVGLVDDLFHLRAQTKFLFALLGGVILFSLGAVLPLTPWYTGNVV